MVHSKLEVTNQLRNTGKWPEADAYKNGIIRECRHRGILRQTASDIGWDAMERKYILGLEELPLPPEVIQPKFHRAPSEVPAPQASVSEDELVDFDVDMPRGTFDLVRDGSWVYEHLVDRSVVPGDAPSAGAWSMLRWARKYQSRFFEIVLPKLKGAATDDEEKRDRGERLRIEDMEKLLKKMLES